jgi:hypothetical protein
MSENQPTFKAINLQGVESSTGFVVQFTGRFTLEYRDGNFCMECRVERNAVSVPELPFGNLTAKRRAEIVANIRAALEFLDPGYYAVS